MSSIKWDAVIECWRSQVQYCESEFPEEEGTCFLKHLEFLKDKSINEGEPVLLENILKYFEEFNDFWMAESSKAYLNEEQKKYLLVVVMRVVLTGATQLEKQTESAYDLQYLLESLPNVEAMQAISELIRSDIKPTRTWVTENVQLITPRLLIDIVNYRKKHTVPALPYCQDVRAIAEFEKTLKEQGVSNWHHGYLNVKKEACFITERRLRLEGVYGNGKVRRDAVTYLTETDFWFIAFSHYQQAHYGHFKNSSQFFQASGKILRLVLLSIGQLLTALCLLAVSFVAWNIVIFAAEVILPWKMAVYFGGIFFPGPFLIGLVLDGLQTAYEVQKSMLTIVACLLMMPLMLVIVTPSLITALADELTQITMRLWQTLTGRHDAISEIQLFDNLDLQSQEAITRLQWIGTPSALAKAEVLRLVYNAMCADQETLSIADRLNKKYQIAYGDDQYLVSFNEVAATRRVSDEVFLISSVENPPATASTWSLFKPTTMGAVASYQTGITRSHEGDTVKLTS
ncbi:MAG: hypothetical protein P1U36_02260 [Legionellaceae bacterium]|nr:hypothetical protein [Legionellaceae bacterium]